jgi:hypothetical protein
LLAFENTRPRARAGWRNSTGWWFIRIAAAAATIFVFALGRVEAQTAAAPDSGGDNIRFYVGLSHGGLADDNEDDLRAFAVIQDHLKTIKSRLSIKAPTRDLTFWNWDDWVKLRWLPITHYIVAHPKRKSPSEIEVEWHVGKFPTNDFSANKEPEYVGILRQKTIITISGSDTAPIVAQQDGSPSPFEWSESAGAMVAKPKEKMPVSWNDWTESAGSIAIKLNKIFPETQEQYRYFVDCFRNYVSDWQDVHRKMMVELSEQLAKGVKALAPALRLDSVELASSMCSESKYRELDTYHYRDAYLYVGGSIWLYGKNNWVQPRITVRNVLRDDRDKLAFRQIGGAGVDEPPELDQFCMKSREFSFTAIDMLKTYIQADGFHFRQPIDLGDWKC